MLFRFRIRHRRDKMGLPSEYLIVGGVVLAIIAGVWIAKKTVKLAIFIGVIALIMVVGGSMLQNIKDQYNVEVKDNVLTYTIAGETNSIDISLIENVQVDKSGKDTEMTVNIKGDVISKKFNIPDVAYDWVIKGVIEKNKIKIVDIGK